MFHILFIYIVLGAAAIGHDTEAVATALLDAIGEFAMQEKPSFLCLVKITIFKPEMFSKYENAVKSKIEGAKSRKGRGALRRGFGKLY